MKNPCYSPSILPLMQTLLATLADIEFAHERELQRIDASSAEPALKQRLRAKLDAKHRERRDPYVHELGILEARLRADTPRISGGPSDRMLLEIQGTE